MIVIDIDREAVSKQIKNSHLKRKLTITVVFLLLSILTWIGIRFLGPQTAVTDPEYEALALPFTFNINQNVLDMLLMQHQYTEEDLEYFTIFIADPDTLNVMGATKVVELTGPNIGQVKLLTGGETRNETDSGPNFVEEGGQQDEGQTEFPSVENTQGGL